MATDTILVTIRDVGNHQALLEAVLDVAEPTDATVVLAKAYSEEEYEQRVDELDFEGQPKTDQVAQRNETVRDAETVLREAAIEYEVRGVVGEEGDALVELAKTIDADLMYIQGKGRTPTGKALFGSTAQTILLNAPCPVTYVRG
ncbi:universal stress protein [Halalkalicoccus salilacus]|uniref:universal stress protein n=1 Tax=Halalkalicoccus TaxID=332246 RepID=UPI002F964B3C